MAMENWNEFSEKVVAYCDSETAQVDEFTATMAKNFIVKGTNSPREQVRYSKTIKDILSDFEDSPLRGRSGGSRASGVQRLSAELQAVWADLISVSTEDGITTIIMAEDAYNYHTTFAGKKENGVPITTWGSNENMLRNVLINKLESGFVSAHKEDN